MFVAGAEPRNPSRSSARAAMIGSADTPGGNLTSLMTWHPLSTHVLRDPHQTIQERPTRRPRQVFEYQLIHRTLSHGTHRGTSHPT